VGKYKYGNNLIKLVRDAPHKLSASIRGGDEFKLDRVVLSGFFGKTPSDTGGLSKAKEKKRSKKDGDDDASHDSSKDQQRRLKTYLLDARPDGGFAIGPNEEEQAPPPEKLVVQVAYDVSAGNPLKKYSKYDFDFRKVADAIEVTAIGCHYSVTGPNELTFDEFQDDFAIEVIRFDTNRDLYISPRATNPAVESSPDSSQSEVNDGETA
jgi:hypothetical protein